MENTSEKETKSSLVDPLLQEQEHPSQYLIPLYKLGPAFVVLIFQLIKAFFCESSAVKQNALHSLNIFGTIFLDNVIEYDTLSFTSTRPFGYLRHRTLFKTLMHLFVFYLMLRVLLSSFFKVY